MFYLALYFTNHMKLHTIIKSQNHIEKESSSSSISDILAFFIEKYRGLIFAITPSILFNSIILKPLSASSVREAAANLTLGAEMHKSFLQQRPPLSRNLLAVLKS